MQWAPVKMQKQHIRERASSTCPTRTDVTNTSGVFRLEVMELSNHVPAQVCSTLTTQTTLNCAETTFTNVKRSNCVTIILEYI